MTNTWIAGLILLLVAVAAVIPTVQTSISKATVPYFIDNETMTGWTSGLTLGFVHPYIINQTETCYNASNVADKLTRDVNYTMNYVTGVLTNKTISKAWVAGTMNCTYWYGDESYQTSSVNRNLMSVFMIFLVIGILMFFMTAVGLL